MKKLPDLIALQEFAKWIIRQGPFQAGDLDWLSIEEKAHQLGLIKPEEYDPEKHGDVDYAEPGELIFTFTEMLTTAPSHVVDPDGTAERAYAEAAGVCISTIPDRKT